VGGVSRQMEAWREGFDSVFPSSALKMFYPEELEMVFCGANQVKCVLMKSILQCSHQSIMNNCFVHFSLLEKLGI